MVKNKNPSADMVYQDFGMNTATGGKNVGTTIIKTCPSGDYDRDNYCGISTGWTSLYAK